MYRDEMLLFGNIENKVLLYDLHNFDPEAADVFVFLTQKL